MGYLVISIPIIFIKMHFLLLKRLINITFYFILIMKGSVVYMNQENNSFRINNNIQNNEMTNDLNGQNSQKISNAMQNTLTPKEAKRQKN